MATAIVQSAAVAARDTEVEAVAEGRLKESDASTPSPTASSSDREPTNEVRRRN